MKRLLTFSLLAFAAGLTLNSLAMESSGDIRSPEETSEKSVLPEGVKGEAVDAAIFEKSATQALTTSSKSKFRAFARFAMVTTPIALGHYLIATPFRWLSSGCCKIARSCCRSKTVTVVEQTEAKAPQEPGKIRRAMTWLGHSLANKKVLVSSSAILAATVAIYVTYIQYHPEVSPSELWGACVMFAKELNPHDLWTWTKNLFHNTKVPAGVNADL